MHFVIIIALATTVVAGAVGYYAGLAAIVKHTDEYYASSFPGLPDPADLPDLPPVPHPHFLPEEKLDRSQWQTYKSAKYGFTLQYPDGWEAYEGGAGGNDAISILPADHRNGGVGYEPFRVIVSNCAKTTILDCISDDYALGTLEHLEGTSFNEVISFNEVTGEEPLFAISKPVVDRLVYFIRKDNHLFELSYLNEKDYREVDPSEDRYHTIVRNILDSFRFTN